MTRKPASSAFSGGKKTGCGTCGLFHSELEIRRVDCRRCGKVKQETLDRLTAGNPAPKVVGIDEISIRKGHTYRIVVSDLEKRRPIWFGGKDRSEASAKAGLGASSRTGGNR